MGWCEYKAKRGGEEGLGRVDTSQEAGGVGRGWGEVGGWVGGIPLIGLKNPRCPFHAFWNILIPYSRFSRSDKTDPKHLWARASFPKLHIWGIV